MLWAVDLFKEWWKQRAAKPGCDMRILWGDLNNVHQVSKGNLAFSLCAFVSKVKKKDGTEYPGAALYQMIVCIQFFLQKHGIDWKILDDPDFVRLCFTLDNVMKQQAKAGLGLKKSAQVISVTDEEKMWSDSILGDSNPDQLCETLMYLLGINLALRGGASETLLSRAQPTNRNLSQHGWSEVPVVQRGLSVENKPGGGCARESVSPKS